MSGRYEKVLDWGLGVVLFVDYTTLKGEVVDYSLALLLKEIDGVKTIRVYDGAQGSRAFRSTTVPWEKE